MKRGWLLAGQLGTSSLTPVAPDAAASLARRFPARVNRTVGRTNSLQQPTTKMTIKRVMAFVATFAGWLLLVVSAVEIGLVLYYRPTIEYTYVEGRPRPIPSWLTGESVGFAFGAFLTVIGSSLLWAGIGGTDGEP